MAYYPEYTLFDNNLQAYLTALAVAIGLYIIFKIFKTIVLQHFKKIAKKIPGKYDDFIFNLVDGISLFSLKIISLFIGLQWLNLAEKVSKPSHWIIGIIIFWEGVKAGKSTIKFFTNDYIDRKGIADKSGDVAVINTLGMVANFALWVIAGLLLLQNLGFNVNSLIASLGIGGIAVALALQNVLGDLFSSLSIFFDKPFQVGDFIIFGKEMGTVKKVGLKTTRIKTPQGQQLVVANSDITKARIQNFQKMEKRRINFLIGIAYETPIQKVEAVPLIIGKIFENNDDIELLRCYFKSYGDFSLIFEIVYNINNKNFQTYIDNHHAINIAIKKSFEKEKIKFAYPTQTVYMKK